MKKFVAIMMSLSLVMCLGACSSSEESSSEEPAAEESTEESASDESADAGSSGDQTIGMMSLSMSEPFAVNMETGIRKAADEKGYDFITIDSGADPEAELTGIDTMNASGVGAFYLISIDTAMVWDNVQQLAPGMGMLAQSADEGGATARVVEDNIGMADMFIDSLDAFMEEKGMDEANVGFLWIAGADLEDNENYAKRMEVLDEIDVKLEGRDDVHLVDEYVCADNDEEAISNCESMLNAHPEVTVFFCYNNDIAIKSANTIQGAVADCTDYYVFSSESDEESFNLIADAANPYRACADYDQEAMGYDIGQQLIDYVENGTMEDVVVEKTLVDWRNIEDYLN